MDDVAQRIASYKWSYAPQDQQARAELEARLKRTAREQRLIDYTDLVSGVRFHLESVNDGKPFDIDAYSWTELNRAILGDFLGSIAADSYLRDGFLLSAVAVLRETGQPSEPFFKWSRELRLLTDNSELGRVAFWNEQVKVAYRRYKA